MDMLRNFHYTNVLVLGLARSGTAAAKILLENGKNVRITDRDADWHDNNVQELQALGAELILGTHPISILDNIEVIVKNPGIPYEVPLLVEAKERGIPIITEIEIAGQLAPNSIIGITGSNGKTTTTTLTTKMLAASDQNVKVAGNIGTVATDVAQDLTKDETLVLELSSFQLLGVQTFKPKVAVLLNIYEAHLDYHKTLENYQQAKCNIFINQSKDDYLVYNAENETVVKAINDAKATLIPFSTKTYQRNGAYVDEEFIYFQGEKIINRKDVVLVGDHNLENILASISAAKLNGATNEGIKQVLTTFSSVKHRLQFVKNIHDRIFYNDSKATNILATQKALASFQQPVILLAGGLDRGNGFSDLLPYLQGVKAMVVFGQTAPKLKTIAEQAGIGLIEEADNVDDAVPKAYELSEANDVILLSPACASWDQYKTFEQRGDMFIQAVHRLM
ncbi:UDP-N-acetylmuramoyl-L-alanine--D-glutamate ligase [Oceanobacillus halotolerans]|uniref:UDP-N-acetylmuramoyl-L-alanine--D-glutamate ligase n=1 Tax=Oceanobacillus halotolerans TaxID=2663380 RepID=UPI0013DAEB06|nr:UDP-N-acetylmuramoyl-L-alanine--D-glutamate ligase [Oceanobacillus halotolerans]